jgi:hypothetical protein
VAPPKEVAGSSLVSINASSILTLATFGGGPSAVSSDAAGPSLPVVVLEGSSNACYCSCLCPLSGFDMLAFNGSTTSAPPVSTGTSQPAANTLNHLTPYNSLPEALTTSAANKTPQASSITTTENPGVAPSPVAGTNLAVSTSSTSALFPTTTTEVPTASIDINTVSLYPTLTVNIL